MKKFLVSITCIAGLVFAALAVSCEGQIADFGFNTTGGNVVIKIADSDGRTIMPLDPVFSGYELSLIDENGLPSDENVDTSGIAGAGVTVNLAEGTWTITLSAYQTINEKRVLAAKGTKTLKVTSEKTKYTVSIELLPIAIDDKTEGENGLFSFNITLPSGGLDSAVLDLGNFGKFDLLDRSTGSKELVPGYYDFSIILTKNGRSAGIFETAHIYSGLVSPAVIDLSNITFADIVYLTGELNGVRLGTITISDEDGNVIETKEINDNSDERSKSWLVGIPAGYIGEPITVTQTFNGESESTEILALAPNGSADVNLTLNPASAKYINLADWYSKKNTSGTELFFGFDLTVNFIKVIKSGSVENIILDNAVTAQEFKASDYASGSITGFELYNAADRGALITAINAAQTGHDGFANVSVNGKEFKSFQKWVTSAEKAAYQNAINTAIAAKNDPTLTDAEIANAEAALADAAAAFENAKKSGTYMVDKSPLAQAIVNANAKMIGVTEAADGSKVLNTDKWATPEAFAALRAAIATAQAYIDATDNTDDDQDVVNTKVATLNNAAAAFNTQNGSLIRTGIVFEFTVNMPKDENIVIPEVQAMSWAAGDTFTLTAEGFDTYQWYVDGKFAADGDTFILNARDYSATTHNLTLRVTKGGVPYTKTITFTVK